MQRQVTDGTPHLTPPPITEETEVVEVLGEAGRKEEPVLDDTAISGQMQRLEDGEISKETQLQYVDDLAS